MKGMNKSANFAGEVGTRKGKKGKASLPPQMGGRMPKALVMKKPKDRSRK